MARTAVAYSGVVSEETYVTLHALSSRTQIVIGISVAAVIGWPIIANGLKASTLASVGVAFVALAFMAGFRQMTVRVNHIDLQVVFAYGWPRRTVRLSEVVDVSIHRMRALYGWGIRAVPNGMLWRAGGHHAVRLELSSGRYLYIGAANCEDLAREISERLPAR